MPEKKMSENVELGNFLEIAGKSLSEAQSSLLSGLNLHANVVLNNADLEVKVTVDSENGKIVVKPISTEEIRTGAIDPGLLSTLRISYVSTLEEPVQTGVSESTAAAPTKTPAQMIEQVLGRADIRKLAGTKGDLQVKPTFVAEKARWLISVEDKSGNIVKEMVLPD